MFKSTHIKELQVEEKRTLGKICRRAHRLMAEDPRRGWSKALAEACAQMPRTYAHYEEARHQLIAFRVPPLPIDDFRRGKG